MVSMKFTKKVFGRRQFLLATAAVAGSAAIAACGGISTQGANPVCNVLQMNIANDRRKIQDLQKRKATLSDTATIAQTSKQIKGLQQDIASLQKKARQNNC